jgi:hypothetical protein
MFFDFKPKAHNFYQEYNEERRMPHEMTVGGSQGTTQGASKTSITPETSKKLNQLQQQYGTKFDSSVRSTLQTMKSSDQNDLLGKMETLMEETNSSGYGQIKSVQIAKDSSTSGRIVCNATVGNNYENIDLPEPPKAPRAIAKAVVEKDNSEFHKSPEPQIEHENDVDIGTVNNNNKYLEAEADRLSANTQSRITTYVPKNSSSSSGSASIRKSNPDLDALGTKHKFGTPTKGVKRTIKNTGKVSEGLRKHRAKPGVIDKFIKWVKTPGKKKTYNIPVSKKSGPMPFKTSS